MVTMTSTHTMGGKEPLGCDGALSCSGRSVLAWLCWVGVWGGWYGFTAGPECVCASPPTASVSPCSIRAGAGCSRVSGSQVAADSPAGERQRRLRTVAVECVVRGWGVLSGPACDGLRHVAGHSHRLVDGLVPVLPGARTLHSAREVRSWWTVAPYGIVARGGLAVSARRVDGQRVK